LQPALDRVEKGARATLSIRPGDPLAAQFAAFGARSEIQWPRIAVQNPGGVAIGDDVFVRAHACFEAMAPRGEVIIRFGNQIQIGYGVRFVAVNGIVLEDETAVGHGSTLSDTIHAYKEVEEGGVPWQAPLRVGDPLRVARGAWIGNNTVVTGGITIGEGAIIAPNSVINRNVPPETIVGGNPAQLLRRKRGGTWEWLVDPDVLDLETQLAIADRQG
jgi:acetyltransferase-like isoleucine patch superfamily enzyme